MEQVVHLGDTRGDGLEAERSVGIPGKEFREDGDAVVVDADRVFAAPGGRPAELGYPDDPPVGRDVEQDGAVADVLEVLRREPSGVLCGVEHRRPAVGEETHEPHGLLAELVIVTRQVVQLRDRVDDHPVGVDLANAFDDGLHERLALDLARVEHVVGPFLGERLGSRAQVEELDRVDVEAERPRVRPEVLGVLLQVDEQRRLVRPGGVEELQAEDRLARSRGAVEHVAPTGDETAVEHRVEPLDARRETFDGATHASWRHRDPS